MADARYGVRKPRASRVIHAMMLPPRSPLRFLMLPPADDATPFDA